MKLLFDQNISFRIVSLVDSHFEQVSQVRNIGIENFSDIEIWQFAKKENYTIVTFDADFIDIAYLKGHPPKIIWLRTGNMTTRNIAKFLIHKKSLIQDFLLNDDFEGIACLELE